MATVPNGISVFEQCEHLHSILYHLFFIGLGLCQCERSLNVSFYFTFSSKVQEGDQIVLESVKFPGQYLHSSYPYKMDNFINYGSEINIGVERSGCTLVHFFRPSPQTNCMLRVCRSFNILTVGLKT